MSNTYFNISDKLRLYEFDGLLDQYGDATAAYSLRKLRNGYTGDAIRVRRSSDDTERDMGFWNNELDTVALLDWVNEEINIADYNSISNVGNTIATKIADFTYNATSDGTAGSTIRPKISFTNATAGNSYRLIITPSNQTGTINFKLYDGSSYIITGNDLSEGIDITFTANGEVFLAFDGNQVFNVDFTIELNALTADGYVHTWYDQSANANHAVQGTDTEQPKIVDAGSVLLFNSKPCIIPDGVDDNLLFTNITSTSHYISIVGGDTTKGRFLSSSTSYLNYIESGTYNRYRIDGTIYNLSARILDVQNLITWTRVTTNSNFYQNSVLNTNNTVIANALDLGQFFKNTGDSTTASDGKFQEVIIYDSDQSSNRTGIETNINTYYSIY